MAVNYSGTTKNARLSAVVAKIDQNSANGNIYIRDASNVILANVNLAFPSATVAANTITFSGFPRSDTAADATGTATNATITSANGDVIISGLTVGQGTGDVNLDSTSITLGQTLTLNSVTITHAV